MAKLHPILYPLQQAEHLRSCTLKSFTMKYFLVVFLDSPSVREQGKGLFLALLVPLSALNTPGCAGSEPFSCSRAGCLFLGVFFWLLGTAFPRCAGVRVRSWLQPDRKEASGASAWSSLVAPGPVELFAKADLQAWGCALCAFPCL